MIPNPPSKMGMGAKGEDGSRAEKGRAKSIYKRQEQSKMIFRDKCRRPSTLPYPQGFNVECGEATQLDP